METDEQAIPIQDGLRVTPEEYLDLGDDGFQYDMINGELKLAPEPPAELGRVRRRFVSRLAAFLKRNDSGFVFPEIDIILPDGGDVLRANVSFLLTANLRNYRRMSRDHIHGVPDMVVEIQTPTGRDLKEKAERYLVNGVQELWLLNLNEQAMWVWHNRGDVWEKSGGDVLKSELLGGFEVSTGEVFS